MRSSYRVIGSLARGALTLAAGAFLVVSVASSARAGTLRARTNSGNTGSASNELDGNPGYFHSTYYETTTNGDSTRFSGTGDNLLDLFNPTAANGTLCALIYVFDADQELGECCGCPITPNGLLALSVETDLTDNWEPAPDDTGAGVIDIMDSLPNNIGCASHPPSGGGTVDVPTGGCNGGCDPTSAPILTANLSGYITHNQIIAGSTGLTEVDLIDEGTPDTAEQTYLVEYCGFAQSNGSGFGYCHCPAESD